MNDKIKEMAKAVAAANDKALKHLLNVEKNQESNSNDNGIGAVNGDTLAEQQDIAREEHSKEEAKQSVINDAIDQKREEVAEEENFVAEGHQQYRGPS